MPRYFCITCGKVTRAEMLALPVSARPAYRCTACGKVNQVIDAETDFKSLLSMYRECPLKVLRLYKNYKVGR